METFQCVHRLNIRALATMRWSTSHSVLFIESDLLRIFDYMYFHIEIINSCMVGDNRPGDGLLLRFRRTINNLFFFFFSFSRASKQESSKSLLKYLLLVSSRVPNLSSCYRGIKSDSAQTCRQHAHTTL